MVNEGNISRLLTGVDLIELGGVKYSRMARYFLIIGAFSFFMIYFGCSSVKEVRPVPTDTQAPLTEGALPTQPAQEALTPQEVEYTLGINDVLSISVYGRPEMSRDAQVKKDGKIYLPLTGGIPVNGLTVSEAMERVTNEIASFIRRPLVTLEVKEYASRQVLVIGAVGKVGVVPLVRDTTLLDAVTLAGGVRGGSLKEVFLLRKGRISVYDLLAVFEKGDISQNITLQSRDIVFVPSPEDRRVYVLGRVVSPGIVPLTTMRMGLIEAISSAGGFRTGAVTDEVRVIRGGLSNPTLFSVDIDRVLKGKGLEGQGFTLASGDIIYVPDSALTSWNKILEQIRPTLELVTFPVTTISQYMIIKAFSEGRLGTVR